MQKHMFTAYKFGLFRLIPEQRLLLREGQPLALTLKAFDILYVLVQRHGQIVKKDELMNKVWPEHIVEEANLTQQISTLRRALNESPKRPRYIETIPRYGYRFIAVVTEIDEGAGEAVIRARLNESIDSSSQSQDANNESPGKLKAVPDAAEHVADNEASSKLITPPQTVDSPWQFNQGKKGWLVALALFACLGLAITLLSYKLLGGAPLRKTQFQPQLIRLTNGGDIRGAAISPSGKYIVYAAEDEGQQALYVRQVDATRNVQLVAPASCRYEGVTFSPDGNSVYYVRSEQNSPSTLYQIPLLGGVSKQVLSNVESPVAFSPDGKRMAFIRKYSNEGKVVLFISNTDGTEEQPLSTRTLPDFFTYNAPTWSPDGKIIACVGGTVSNVPQYNIIGVRVTDKTEQALSPQSWFNIGQVAWFTDGSGLLMTASDQATEPRQIWYLPYSSGTSHRITNDLSNYSQISLAADSSALITLQNELLSSLWIIPANKSSVQARRLNSDMRSGYYGLSWAANNRIVYVSETNGTAELWLMEADGANPRQLTIGAQVNLYPTVTPDGRNIIFASYRSGTPHIWKLDVDGMHQYQLTNGKGETLPQCSVDGKFVIYEGVSSGIRRLWKVPIDGGEATQLTDKPSLMPTISPDGSQIACYYLTDESSAKWQIALIPIKGGAPTKIIDMPTAIDPYSRVPHLQWAVNGSALTYVNYSDSGGSNIWSLPLDGSMPKQLTDFNNEQIFGYQWSQDGKQLLLSRGMKFSDVILMRNFIQ